jgi:hypothetical protein
VAAFDVAPVAKAADLTLQRHCRNMIINGPRAPSGWQGSEPGAMHTKR